MFASNISKKKKKKEGVHRFIRLIARSPDDRYHDSRKYTARKVTDTIVPMMYRRNFRTLAVRCMVRFDEERETQKGWKAKR